MKLPFGKKNAGAAQGVASPPVGRRSAVERVGSLSSQGISEPEIIRALRSEGYTPMEVDNAMKQALRSAVDSPLVAKPQSPAMPPQPPPPAAPELAARPQPPSEADRRRIFPDKAVPPQNARYAAPSLPLPMEEMQRMQNPKQGGLPELPSLVEPQQSEPPPIEDMPEDDFNIPGIGDDISPLPKPELANRPRGHIEGKRQLEEMTEAIVEEKAEIFSNEVDRISDEVTKLDAKIQVLDERIEKIENRKRTQMDEIKGSIAEYKDSITDVSARMESVEKAMKDSMTPMMQTLRSLSDAVKEIKSK